MSLVVKELATEFEPRLEFRPLGAVVVHRLVESIKCYQYQNKYNVYFLESIFKAVSSLYEGNLSD